MKISIKSASEITITVNAHEAMYICQIIEENHHPCTSKNCRTCTMTKQIYRSATVLAMEIRTKFESELNEFFDK